MTTNTRDDGRMTVVLVYRPEAADGDPSDKLDGIEVYAVFPGTVSDRDIEQYISKVADANPRWQFHLSRETYVLRIAELERLGVGY
jgi:hypothetical protein